MAKRIIVIFLILVGLMTSFFVAGQRARLESRNKAVDIIVEYDEIAEISSATGTAPLDVIMQFKKSGITGVAVSSRTFKDLLDFNGNLVQLDSFKYLISNKTADDIYYGLKTTIPALNITIKNTPEPISGKKILILPKNISLQYLAQIPVGLPPDIVNIIRKADIQVIARFPNYSGVSPNSIDKIFRMLKKQGVSKVIFSGDQVLGFNGCINETARAIDKYGLYFGRVEFAKQRGEIKLAKKIPGRIITVHSINQSEMPALTVPTIIERFQRAVRERGARICYVRMYEMASGDLIKTNTRYIASIKNAIENVGYKIGNSHQTEDLQIAWYFRLLAGVGVAGGTLALIFSILNFSLISTIIVIILTIAACTVLPTFGTMGAKLTGFISAIVFPTLAIILITRNTPDTRRIVKLPLLKAFIRSLEAFLIAVTGGVLIVGLLSSRETMLNIDQFFGVKAAHFLPILILAALYAGGIAWQEDRWAIQRRRFVRNIKDIFSNPILVGQAIAALASLIIIAFMVIRSGNDAAAGVSDSELHIRSLLDKILIVRPRFKEFLIGYPTLIVGMAFAVRGYRQWAVPFVIVGTIGLISTLNTFCHLHTPLLISAIRIFNGFVIGTIIGILLYLIIRNWPGRE